MLKVSAIIVNYNTIDLTAKCLDSLHPSSDREIIVVDNASSDDSTAKLKARFPQIRLIESPKNLGFAGGCKLGVEASTGEYLAFVNSDCLDKNDALGRLAKYLDNNPGVTVAVPRLLESDGRVQNNVARLPALSNVASEYLLGWVAAWYKDLANWSEPTAVEAFSGAALMIRRVDYAAAGGFDTRYFMYMEDVELSYRLGKAGKLIHYLPTAIMTHSGGGSSQSDQHKLNKLLESNRIDYIKQHFGFGQRQLAVAIMRLGAAIRSLKHAIR